MTKPRERLIDAMAEAMWPGEDTDYTIAAYKPDAERALEAVLASRDDLIEALGLRGRLVLLDEATEILAELSSLVGPEYPFTMTRARALLVRLREA